MAAAADDASGKELVCPCRRHGFNSWVRKIPWRRAWQPTPVFLPGESHGQRSPAVKESVTTKVTACTQRMALNILND